MPERPNRLDDEPRPVRTAAPEALPASAAPLNSRGRVIFASLIGTSIEYYDFYVYATAAVLVFPSVFFVTDSPATSLLASFAVFGVAFAARPIGSILFGHFGDRIGRKGTLVASLLTMGVATCIIGFIPSAHTPGWELLAPALLVLMRFAQGIGLGGEWSGAVLLATENAPVGRRAVYGTFPQLGAPIGFIAANGVFLILAAVLDDEAFLAWGWRVPFIASALLVIVGLYVRLQLVESSTFQRAVTSDKIARIPLVQAFRTSWRQMVLGTFMSLSIYSLIWILSTFTLTFGTAPVDATVPGLGYGREAFLIMIIIGVVPFGIFTLVSGPLAERFGRRRVLICSALGAVGLGLCFVPLLGGGVVGIMTLLLVGFSLLGLSYGPIGAVLPELFPTNVRYTGSAIAYNVASILGGALAPFIAVSLWTAADGSPVLVGVYLSAMCAITLVALLVSRETRGVAYEDNLD